MTNFNFKKRVTKTLAVALSVLSAAGSINTHAMHPDFADKIFFSSPSTGHRGYAPGFPSLLSYELKDNNFSLLSEVEREFRDLSCKSSDLAKKFSPLMNKLHNLKDLFNEGILKKIDKIERHDDAYWEEDVKQNLEDNIGLFTFLKKTFENNMFIKSDMVDSKKENEILESLRSLQDLNKVFRETPIFTRKAILILIILNLRLHEERKGWRDEYVEGYSPCNYPQIPADIIHAIHEKDVKNITTEECDKLLAFLPVYFALHKLIKCRLNSLNFSNNEMFFSVSNDFIEENESLYNGWMNSSTTREYIDYSEAILDLIEKFENEKLN